MEHNDYISEKKKKKYIYNKIDFEIGPNVVDDSMKTRYYKIY